MQNRGGNTDHRGAVRVPIEDVLDLHTFQPKEIPGLLEEYLNACRQAGIYSVRIIHGKGRGVLRDRVRGLLKRLSIVSSFSEAPSPAGGWGATIVELARDVGCESPEWDAFADELDQGARAMGMSLTESHIGQFVIHAKELLAWNRFANLTAITGPRELAAKQFLDALFLPPFIPPGCRVLDIGSGGGFPGIPLKIVRPDLDLSLIDASRKKVHFLRHSIAALGLGGIEARHTRAEDLARDARTESRRYEVIVSKAVSKLDKLVEQATPLLCRPGLIIAMKGISVDDELERARSGITSEDLTVEKRDYRLPRIGTQRSLILLRKK